MKQSLLKNTRGLFYLFVLAFLLNQTEIIYFKSDLAQMSTLLGIGGLGFALLMIESKPIYKIDTTIGCLYSVAMAKSNEPVF